MTLEIVVCICVSMVSAIMAYRSKYGWAFLLETIMLIMIFIPWEKIFFQ